MDDPIDVLRNAKRIAVVGASASPGKDAHDIPKHLADHGYDVVPVNPKADEIFGRKAYKTLADVPGTIDLVNVFRPSEEAPDIARQAAARGAKGLWLQTGITSAEAARIAGDAGMRYVEDACVRVISQQIEYLDRQKAARAPMSEPAFGQIEAERSFDRAEHVRRAMASGLTREQAERHADEDMREHERER